MSKTTELFKVGQPKASAYIGMASPTRPLEVTALRIPDGCQIQFDRVEWEDGLTKETFDCGIGDAWSTERGRMRYSLCDCIPFLDSKVQRLYIDTPGHYIAVIVPEDGCLGMIEAYVREAPEMAGLLDDRLRGCCGLPQADLQAIKTTPLPRYKVGEQFSYSIRLINAGPSNASGAEVRDLLPEELELSGAITLAYGNGAMGPATLTREQLASFEVTSFPPTGYVDVTITGSFPEHGAYLNRVCIQPPEGVEDVNQGNNCSQVLLNIDELKPKIEVSKTASDITPLTGTTGSYTIMVTNAGIDPEVNVILTDALPANFTYAGPFAVTATGGATGVPPTVTQAQMAAGVLVAATFPPGASISIVVPYSIPTSAAGQAVHNSVHVIGNMTEDSDDVFVTPRAPDVDLTVDKTVSDKTPAVGETVNFSVAYGNAGPAAANGATIRDVGSNADDLGIYGSTMVGLAYAGGATGPASVTVADMAAGVVIPAFPAGSTVTATYGGVVQAGSEGLVISNTATVAAPPGVVETNLLNNTATVQVQVQGECNLKCCDPTIFIGSPSAQGVGAGICVAISSNAANTNRIIYRGRDAVIEEGSATTNGAAGAYLSYTPTKPAELMDCDSVLTVSMKFFDMVGSDGVGDVAIFIHALTQQLQVTPPINGGFFHANAESEAWAWNAVTSYGASNGDSAITGQWADFTNNNSESGSSYTVTTFVPAGSTPPTHYAQWWAVLPYLRPYVTFALHGFMKLTETWQRGRFI
jgi:uncharacterized repeat protein (TIGR01451 family)